MVKRGLPVSKGLDGLTVAGRKRKTRDITIFGTLNPIIVPVSAVASMRPTEALASVKF